MGFLNLKEMEEREIIPGYRAVFVHSENMSLAYWDIDSGAVMPEHSHPHEQIANVLEGRFELTVDSETRVLEPGMVRGDTRWSAAQRGSAHPLQPAGCLPPHPGRLQIVKTFIINHRSNIPSAQF